MGKSGSIKPDGAQDTRGKREWAASNQAAKAMGALGEAGSSVNGYSKSQHILQCLI